MKAIGFFAEKMLLPFLMSTNSKKTTEGICWTKYQLKLKVVER